MERAEIILVVDDEQIVLNMAHAMLTRFGYTVLTAISPSEALSYFEKWPEIQIDLLLIDFAMPEMNGRALVERIHIARPEIPVLYFSAYSQHEELRPLHARGVPYLAKPFTSSETMRKIREVLDSNAAKLAATD